MADVPSVRFIPPHCVTCGIPHKLVRKFNGGDPIEFWQPSCGCDGQAVGAEVVAVDGREVRLRLDHLPHADVSPGDQVTMVWSEADDEDYEFALPVPGGEVPPEPSPDEDRSGGAPLTPEPGSIVRNAARCDGCGDVIESRHRHDFVSCSCGSLCVDGGRDYPRRVFTPGAAWTDLTEYAPVEGDDG